MDIVNRPGILSVRLTVPVTDPNAVSPAAPQVIMRIQCVPDDAIGNWAAPSHVHDLKGLVGHYRRTLPKYSEFFALTQRKRTLQDLELALTTY